MGVSNRHKLLGCKFNGTPAAWVTHYKKGFFGLGGYPPGWNPQGVREGDIIDCIGMLSLHHLGFKVPVEPGEWLGRGFDVVIDYFCGDWWKGDPDAERAMDKSRKRRDLKWFNAFARGLLLGLLSERWEELAAVCAWVEPGLRAEPLLVDEFEETGPELSYLYVSVAASLRPETMTGLAAMEKRLKACESLRPRLLFQAWEAARAGDQSSFEEAFIRSVSHFVAVAGSGPTPIHWIAIHQSIVGLAAMHLGLALPPLPPHLDAVIMTRTSLALDEGRIPAHNGRGGSRSKPRMSDPGDGDELPESQVSPEYVASLIKQFKADRPKREEISSRQLTFTLRGLMRAKAQMGGEDKVLNRDSAEAWFTKNTSIEGHFGDHDHFARCIDIAMKIFRNEE